MPAQSPPPGPPPGGMQGPGPQQQALQQALGGVFGAGRQAKGRGGIKGAVGRLKNRFSKQSPGMPNGGYGQYQPKQQPNPMG